MRPPFLARLCWLLGVLPLAAIEPDLTSPAPLRPPDPVGATPFGPHRSSPDVPLPKHAYSPFDQLDAPPAYQPGPGRDYHEGELVIRFGPEVGVTPLSRVRLKDARGNVALTGQPQLNAALAGQGITALTPVFPNARPPVQVMSPGSPRPIDLTRWYRARTGGPSLAAVAQLKAEAGIEVAEPDYLRKLADEPVAADGQSAPPLPPGAVLPGAVSADYPSAATAG